MPDSISAISSVFHILRFIVPLYIDPTAGGILLQVILGGFAGVAVLVKLFWYRLTSVFRRSKEESEDVEAPPPPDS